jgi:diadenosine tetraphosphate (Ap4A) HIT family hydrolase
MLIRHWDPEKKFEGAVLKVYEHWVLEVSWQQHTLGCYIIFCRREGVRLQSSLTDKELEQLKIVMGEIESALRFSSGKFLPHHFNYLQMGNELPLLHFHGIPRYGEPRALTHEVLGRDPQTTDLNWGGFPPWSRELITSEQMVVLRKHMRMPRENPFYRGLRRAMEEL